MLKIDLVKRQFPEIFRVFISGSSSSGKTYFARNLLAEKLFRCDRIYYFHPDVGEKFPIDWENHLDIPIMTQPNLPSLKELTSFPPYSCLILDDLYKQASNSDDIDYLFRVLSSKKKLHVIIMTQRYFAERGNSLNLRNSSNFHVLMNNADERTNMRVAFSMNLAPEIRKASTVNKQKLYPYILIDRTNIARVNGVQIYTDIFSKYKQVIVNSMPAYLISEADFKSKFQILDKTTAIKNGKYEKKRISIRKKYSESESSTSDESSSEDDRQVGAKYERNISKRTINSKLQRKN